MCKSNIDIIEEDWLKEYGEEVLERLLWEHSRPQYKGDDGEMHHHHIYWATDMYEQEGDGFRFFDEIQISNITGNYRTLVRPRAAKSKKEQEKRTRDKAEVFTPSWVCNAQINLVDEAWFGRKDVFNTEYTDEHGKYRWKATEGKILFPDTPGKTWQDYVCDTRLEITCGEAPYLFSRYDTTTGEPIPLISRIGLLDRKLRVVSENVTDSAEWLHWAKCAIKATYGFEWQGDNILLARESMLKTFLEYYDDYAQKNNLPYRKLRSNTLQTIAYIVSWNIFQMDGLKFSLPRSGELEQEYSKSRQQSLFDFGSENSETLAAANELQKKKIYVKLADWQRNGEANHDIVFFKDLLKGNGQHTT